MRQRGRTWGWVCLCSVTVALGCQEKKPAAPPANSSPTPPVTVEKTFTPAEAAELQKLRIVALGHLENHEFPKAEATLQTLREKLPDDLFVVENLAICRQLAADGVDAARDPAGLVTAMKAADEAIADFERREKENPVPLMLRARLAVKQQQKPAAIAALQTATKRNPKYAPAWYELYQLLRESTERDLFTNPEKRDPILEAGNHVAELSPDNWFFWKDWVVDLAKAQDPRIKPLMERMRTALQPFASTFLRDTRANPVAFLDKAIEAWDGGQKQNVERFVMQAKNLFVSEAANDKNELALHSLEFVRTTFSTKLPDVTDSAAATPLKLTFTPTTVSLPGVNLEDVRAIRSLDADIDGKADLVVLTPRRLQVFSQKDGAWTANFGVDIPGDANAFLTADLDDDADPPPADTKEKIIPSADPEFIVSGPGGLWVFENKPQADGPRTLVLRDKDAPWAGATDVTAVVLLDLDGDGDLDIFAGGPTPRWFIYRGNFLFGEVTERSQQPPEGFRAIAAVAVDWDNDVDIDLLVASADQVAFFQNIRHGRFRYRDAEPMLGYLRDMTPRHAPELDELSILRMQAWHVSADFDNDGNLDVATGDPTPQLRLNRGNGKVDLQPVTFAGTSAKVACGDDVDSDGDVDLWFIGKEAVLALNDNGNQNHWIELRPRGLQEKGNAQSNSKRVNHQAIGSLVELRVGDRYQAGIVDGQSIRFGLGSATKPDAIRIIWTNGVPRVILEPKADMVLTEEMLPIGSCPYLYAWNGERFEFFTDLLWNAPLGLKHTEDIVAGWREWEYLKIDGDRMKPRGDEYIIQLTEELWEITYFDQIKLIAVDHPADTQIFTNEKVGPPEIAQPKIHTVKAPRLPIAARDPKGNDILHEVQQRDGRYTKTYDKKIASGLTPEHYLELDFGNLGDAKQATLFLTGWMYPTDTSIKVQFSQDPTMTLPRPPALWAVDATGEWREVQPFMGFPGGKTKTIAVDVSDAINPRDARLRIVTNMEFYWDHAFLTMDEPPVAVHEQELPLKHADLHFRGCSQAVYQPYNSPEFYDYSQVNPFPQWPPLGGKFTRFGDVTPLMRERDDHLVAFGAGDEITVTFGLPKEPLPDGWVRDFIVYNVGWDKDAVLNTVHGTTVEPLPFQKMTWYGHIDGEARPTDTAYEEYLRTYQTREQNGTAFWNQFRHARQPTHPASRVQAP